MPSVALGHDGNLLFLAVGRGNWAEFGDLEIALALDAGLGQRAGVDCVSSRADPFCFPFAPLV
jgi:hypothetical protein